MFRRRRKTADFAAEIEAHLRLEIDRLRDLGLSDQEAYETARRSFGNVTRAQERYYESRGWSGLDTLLQDIRFGLRVLLKTRGSTIAALLMLALGIGATTGIFSLLDAVLLRSLPVPHAHELILLGKGRWVGSQDTLPDKSWDLFSDSFFKQFRKENKVFTNVAAIDSIVFDSHGHVAHEPEAEKIRVELVSGSYFQTLAITPTLGRLLVDADDQTPGGHPVAVASDAWWRRRFAEQPTLVGTSVSINNTVYRVIGIAPRDFAGMNLGQAPDLWIPLAMEKQISPGWNGLEDKLFQSLYVFGRLKPNIGLPEAGAQTNLLFQQILRTYVGPRPSPDDLRSIRHAQIELTSVANGLPGLRAGFSAPLKILMILVMLVLLIACGNVANLLLARAVARRREVAIRLSLGAGTGRLLRQLFVESGLLGILGALLGLCFAWIVAHVLPAMAAPGFQLIDISVAPDARVLIFALTITAVTVLLFGMAPALYAIHIEANPSLKEGRGSITAPAQSRISRALIVGEVSLSLMLLAGAGLFLRSFLNLLHVDTGFNKHNVLILSVDPNAAGYQVGARLETMMEQVEGRVAALRGVRSASFAFSIFGGGWTGPATVPGRANSGRDPDVFNNITGPNFLSVMQMPLVAGRIFDSHDTLAGQRVAVINQAMARTYFPGVSPLGKTFSVGPEPEWRDIEVVGVVRDAKYMSLTERGRPAAFYPHAQHGMFLYNFMVRYSGDADSVIPQVRKTIQSIDRNLPVSTASSLRDLIDDSTSKQRLIAQLSSAFGVLAAVLASIGIYGVISYGVKQKTNEFGLRMALGATKQDVLWAVFRDVLRLTLLGMFVGIPLPLALSFSSMMRSQLYGLKSYDPVSIACAAVALFILAGLAGYLPARRATEIDPMIALRYE